MEYQVKRNLFGRVHIRFACPQCSSKLSADLSDAGNVDYCPDCGNRFVTPGKQEQERKQREQEQKRIAKKRAREEQRQQVAERQREWKSRRQVEIDRRQKKAERVLARRSQPAPRSDPSPISCPNCGSTQVAANKKGFGLGKAAAGGLLLGPVGLLGGVIGSGKIKITCLKCGNVFAPGQGS